jgi:hypothetical protein
MGEQMLGIALPTCRSSSAPRAMAVLVLLGAGACLDGAVGQTCTVSASSVTLGSGSCTIAPNTTLNGSPAVHATTSAQITTNNITINPFNGGSVGGLAETLGTITFSPGSSISGNWATAASAQTGGQIIFQEGTAINPPFGGGVTALLANGVGAGGQASQIIATALPSISTEPAATLPPRQVPAARSFSTMAPPSASPRVAAAIPACWQPVPAARSSPTARL